MNNLMNHETREMIDQADGARSCQGRKRPWFTVIGAILLFWAPQLIWAANPTVSFTSTPSPITDRQTSLPFAGIDINDPDTGDTVTVDITFPDIRGLFPTNSSLTKPASDVYRLASQSPSNAQTILRALVFTPVGNRIPIGTNEMTTFTITATDMASASNSASVNLTVTPINDASTITGMVVTQINDNVDSPIFLGIVVADVDNMGAQPVTARVSIISANADKLVVGGVLTTSFETNGTPSNVTAALHSLLVRPDAHTVPPKFTNTFQVALNVIDNGGINSPDNTTNTVNVEAANTLPMVTASVYPSNISDSVGAVTPFFLSIVDPDIGEQFAVTLTPLSGSEVYGTLEQPTSFTGSYFAVQTSVAGVHYHPNNVASSQVVRFQFKVTEMLVSNSVITNLFLSEMTTNVQLTILGVNESPEIAGVEAYALRTTDDPAVPPILPFPGVMMIDPDVGQSVTVTLSVLDPAIGSLSNALTGAVGPSLTLSGTTTQITELIRFTTFSANQIPGRVIGSSVSVQLRIEVSDGIATPVRNDQTEVVVMAVNGAPRIDRVAGFPDAAHPARISPFPPVSPFAGVTIADDDSNVTVTISIDDPAKGSLLLKDVALSNLVGFAEQSPSSGVYRLAGIPSNLTVAVTSLEFRISGTYLFPPSAPGGTTFTIQAVDPVLNQTTRILSITVQNEPRNWLVTKTDDDGSKGSLRYAVTNAGNDDVITFALPKYPALIRLDRNLGVIELSRNTTLKGPGADMLTISGDTDGNGDPDTQLFRVNAWVTMEGLTLSRGLAASGANLTGGAIYVGESGRLTLRFCVVTDSRATQWGGGIDVDQGQLDMENCLVRGNSTSEAGGLGGGAISLYTDEACSFVNTTFSSNRQMSASGYGGGALYVENYTPSLQLPIGIIHCTFAENDDAANDGSSIQANVFNTHVAVRNSIFADGRGQNLAVEGAAEIVSEGGNLSDDSTRVFLTQGGVPEEVILLNATRDVRSVNAATILRLPFDEWVRPSGVYRLAVLSPAIANAVAPAEAIDQRGVIRGGTPDSGAFQDEAYARLTLNEFSTDAPSFVEVYVPRDSVAVNLAGYSLWVNGGCRHIFVEPVVMPGFGIVVADTNDTLALVGLTNNPTLVVNPSITNLTLPARGQMELRLPDGRAVNRITYVGVYAETATNDYNFSGDSLTLAPQFVGYAYLPHRIVLPPLLGGADLARTGGANSPGGDTGNTPFGSPNAYPLAQPDAVVVNEDNLTLVPVLNNDLDADGLDQLVITDVSTWAEEGGNDVQAFSQGGALVSIVPTVTNPAVFPMIQGEFVEYNPMDAPDIQALTPGEKLTDTFFYEVLDVGTGNITNYAAGASVLISSPAHRLTNGVQIAISGAAVTNYNGTRTVTVVDDNRFSLNGVAYVGNTEPRGSWRTLNARSPSVRSEGQAILTVVGVNDPPVPVDDTVLNVTEDTVTRIMGTPDLAGSTTAVFTTDSDYPMIPVIAMESLLPNDHDPDSDDEGVSLRIIGVVGEPRAVQDYTGTPGVAPVTITVTNHGLISGAKVVISGYDGHDSYNNLHEVTVVDTNTFTIPLSFVDNHPVKGLWARMDDDNRLSTTSAWDATVMLEIRADPRETSIIYNPLVSSNLNGLAVGETILDSFYYVAQDQHGAAALGLVLIPVAGVNDRPEDTFDPEGGLIPLLPLAGDTPLADFLQTVPADYLLPSALGTPGRQDVSVIVTSAVPSYSLLLPDFWMTDEDTPLSIPQSEVLANASDVDTSDVLRVAWVSPASRRGAAVSIEPGTGNLIYNPTNSLRLNSLARGELIFDSFDVVVSDFAISNPGSVTSLLAVVVRGVNDRPIASNDWYTITEDDVLQAPLATNDIEWDIDGTPPDDRLALNQVMNGSTSVVFMGHFIDLPYNIISNLFIFDPTNALNVLADGWIATSRFDYVVRDGGLFFAVDDEFTVKSGATGVALQVLSNDRDYNPTPTEMWVTWVGNVSASGQVFVTDGKSLLYTPATNYVGDEYFTYMITNLSGILAKGLVHVRVIQDKINGTIDPMKDYFAVANGETVTVSLVANDYFLPENGTGLDVSRILTAPDQGGVVTLSGEGTVRYAPAPIGPGAYPYRETFQYEVTGGGPARGTGTVDILVVDRRGSLNVADDNYAVLANSVGNSLTVLDNDGFMPFSHSSWRITSIVSGPFASVATNEQSILYSPVPGFIGRDTFAYVVSDGLGGTGTGRVTVMVGDVDVLPDVYSVRTNTLNLLDVLANDRVLSQTVPNNLFVQSVAPMVTPQGVMSIDLDGSRLRFAASGVTGLQLFAFTVVSSGGTVQTGQVAVTVVAGNQVDANPDYYSAARDSVANVLDVLANDKVFSSSGGSLVIQSIGTGVGAPNHGGTVAMGPGSLSLVYTPAAGFGGEETFTYTVTDGDDSDVATVLVRVDGGRIHANDDSYTVLYEDDGTGAASTQYVLPVTDNDLVLPNFGQSLSIIAVGLNAAASNAPNQMGGVAISSDGRSLVYTPTNIGLISEYVEQFTYEVTDGTYRRAAATVSVTVQTRTNAAQLGAVDDAFAVRSNTASNQLPVLSNDGIRPAGTAGWWITVILQPPAHGSATLVSGHIYYTPASNYVGWDSLGYAVTDGQGGSGGAMAYVWVGEIPRTPDRFVAISGEASYPCDVVVNDYVLGLDIVALSLLDAGWTSMGGQAIVSNGAVMYTPSAAYTGAYPYTETFEYRLRDQSGGAFRSFASVTVYEINSDSDTATVTVVVEGLNDRPSITADALPIYITDKEVCGPFDPVVFHEIDAFTQELVDVSVALDDPAKGFLRNLDRFHETASGVYTLTNVTSAEATAMIHGLVFDPTDNRIRVPTNEITRFILSITDNRSDPFLDTNTVVDVTAVNDAPVIMGTRAGQTMYHLIPIRLFSSVSITDVDDLGLQPMNVTVTFINPLVGTLTNLSSFVRVTNGVYRATNVSPGVASADLRGMQYILSNVVVPEGASVTNRFSLRVDDRFAPPVDDGVTTVIAYNGAHTTLQPSNTNHSSFFGAAVDNTRDLAVVGAYAASANGANAGSVTLYKRLPAGDNNWAEFKNLTPAAVDADDNFGRAVDVDGDIIAVGAPGDETNGIVKGAVYLFQKDLGGADNWGLLKRIIPTNLSTSAEFGYDVALHADILAVGARQDSPAGNKSGAVFLFGRDQSGPNGWGQLVRIYPLDTSGATSHFGRCVSLNGDNLAIGSPRNNSYAANTNEEGAVYVYNRNQGGSGNWGLVQKVVASHTNIANQFGWDVDIHGGLLAVGAPLMQSEAGGLYLFRTDLSSNLWREVVKLDRPVSTISRFGSSLSLDEIGLLVGAPQNLSGTNVGSAYLYRQNPLNSNHWMLVETINRPTSSTVGLFGGAVSLFGDFAAIGAPVNLTPINNLGRVFMYRFKYNNDPVVCVPMSNQNARLGQPFLCLVPSNTFADPDLDDILTITGAFPAGGNGFVYHALTITGTPLAVGPTPVLLTAADMYGGTTSNRFDIYVFDEVAFPLSARQVWNMRTFNLGMADPGLETTLWGAAADPDGDFSDNNQEYAFGGDALAPDDTGIALELDGLGRGVITYVRRSTDPELTFVLEGSIDLANWVSLQMMVLSESYEYVSAETERVTLTVMIVPTMPVRMYRIAVRF